jgi:parallel beta-helix repeat protein
MDKILLLRKGFVAGIILLFIGTYIIPSTAQDGEKPSLPTSNGHWLYVGGSGPGNYTRIQDAIDNASDGDIVFVYHGIYYENIRATRSIGLLGENQIHTIIDGQEIGGHVVNILSAGVTLYHFTIQNSGGIPNAAAIYVSTEDNHIIENIVTCRPYHGEEGIWLSQSSGNIISNNTIENYHYGIWLEDSTQNNLSKNKITNSWDWGIILGDSDNNMLYQNNMTENNGGIYLRDSNENSISRNELITNYRDIVLTDWGATTSDNLIVNNNIDSATFVAAKQSHNKNMWDENYWGRPLHHPKLIIGQKEFLFFQGSPFHFPPIMLTLLWFNVDWHPAQKPYDIPG